MLTDISLFWILDLKVELSSVNFKQKAKMFELAPCSCQ